MHVSGVLDIKPENVQEARRQPTCGAAGGGLVRRALQQGLNVQVLQVTNNQRVASARQGACREPACSRAQGETLGILWSGLVSQVQQVAGTCQNTAAILCMAMQGRDDLCTTTCTVT